MWRVPLLIVLLVLALPASAAGVLVLGDSISAGYGVPPGKGWVNLLAGRLQPQGIDVVNASVSGDTSAGGRARLPALLQKHAPDLVVIELGGNDGLRGLPVAKLQENLQAMVRAAKAAGARVVLAGMHIPPNYGPRYTDAFHAVYAQVATQEQVALIPFLLEGVATREGYMQADGIHPAAAAQPLLLDNAWPVLAPLLRLK
jgi:acyl-CoA thioesterase-1